MARSHYTIFDAMEKTLKLELQIEEEVTALKNINKSIESLSDKII